MKISLVIFTAGLVFSILGLMLYLQGPKRYIQYESENLGYWTKSVSAGNSKEIVWYFSGSGRSFVSNLTLVMNVSVLDSPVWMYVLNNLQFEIWEDNGTISQAFVSRNVTDRFDLAFETEVNETYHVIAKNPSKVTSSFNLSFRHEGNFLRFDYTLMPLNLFVFALGLGICFVSGKKCLPIVDEKLRNWSFPIYGPRGKRKLYRDEYDLRVDAYLRIKRLSKYFVLALLLIVVFFFLYDVISDIDFFLSWQPLRPEQKLLAFDVLVRNSVLSTFLVLPLLLGVPIFLLLIGPRADDLSSLLGAELGFKRRSKRQFLISKYIYKKLVQAIFSRRFFLFCAMFFSSALPITYFQLWKSQLVTAASFAFWSSALGILGGYIVASGFYETCKEHGFSKYVTDRYLKCEMVTFVILISIGLVYVIFLLLFTTSSFWLSTIESVVFQPVALLEPFPELLSVSYMKFTAFTGILAIIFCFVICGLLIFTVFPYLYRVGARGIFGAFLVFGLTYMTESAVIWILQGQITLITDPLGLVGPAIAALISQIAQGKYSKMMKKWLA